MAKSYASVLAGLIALPLGLVVFGEGVAHAQDRKPIEYPAGCAEVKPESADEGRKAFLAGKAKADESSYDEAVPLLVEAYRKDCTRHGFLQVIASVLEKQGRYEDAVNALQLFIERQAMTGAERAPLETKIKNLRALVEEKKKKDEANRAAAAAAPGGSAPPPPAQVREHTIAPWLVVGVGGAAVVTGIVLHVAAPALPASCDPVDKSCVVRGPGGVEIPDRRLTPKQLEDIQKDRDTARFATDMPIAGTVCLIGGGVLVAGGLVWHFLEPTGPVAKAAAKLPQVVPSVGPGYGGVSLGGAF